MGNNTVVIHSHTREVGKGRALAAALARPSVFRLENGMARALSTQLIRYLVLGLVALAVLVLNGCTQRQAENPFVSPYSTSTPFGG